MKRSRYFTALFLLCASLLTACGHNENQSPKQQEELDIGSAGSSSSSRAAPYLEPVYDPQSNSVTLTDLASNTTLASYQFEPEQFILSTEKVKDGIIVLSMVETETMEKPSSDMVFIGGGNRDENVTVYRFDPQLNLLDRFCLKDAGLPDDLLSYPFAISRDGEALTWAEEDSIYRYTLDTKDLKQVPIKLPETVYFDQIRYSEDGKILFYFGGSGQEDVTFYGALDVETGEGTLFQAKDFDTSSITVTGEYAVVNAAVLPGAVSGNGRVLLIDSAGTAGKEITLKSQEENDLAVVTEDGKTLVTCAATDSKGGVLRCYDTVSSDLKLEQAYSSEQDSKPYLLVVQGQSAQAVLYTEQGFVLSSPMKLP